MGVMTGANTAGPDREVATQALNRNFAMPGRYSAVRTARAMNRSKPLKPSDLPMRSPSSSTRIKGFVMLAPPAVKCAKTFGT